VICMWSSTLIFVRGRSSNGARPKIIVYMDHALWKFFMLKNELNRKSLRWLLLLQEFEFEVFDQR